MEDLTNLDLAYAPPFGSAKDPAIIAGMVAQNALRGLVPLVTPAELARLLESGEELQIVDVRESYEFELGALPNAVNIPVGELRTRLGELDRDRPVILYDGDGHQGYVAARVLLQRGFGQVFALTGGFTVWSVYQTLRSEVMV